LEHTGAMIGNPSNILYPTGWERNNLHQLSASAEFFSGSIWQ